MNAVYELRSAHALFPGSVLGVRRRGAEKFLRPKNPVPREMALAALCRIYRGRAELPNSTVRWLSRGFLSGTLNSIQLKK